jgi:hypothetical protein
MSSKCGNHKSVLYSLLSIVKLNLYSNSGKFLFGFSARKTDVQLIQCVFMDIAYGAPNFPDIVNQINEGIKEINGGYKHHQSWVNEEHNRLGNNTWTYYLEDNSMEKLQRVKKLFETSGFEMA